MSARLLTVIVGGTLLCGATLLSAAPKHSSARGHGHSPPAESREVALVLQREARQPLDRQAELKPVLIREPDSPSAHWHSGYVQAKDSWRRYDDPLDSDPADLLQSYREARYPLIASDYKSHLHLALWCRKHGLHDQEYAHLTAAFELAPPAEQVSIAERIGYRQIGGQWLNREELSDLASGARHAEAGLKLWAKRIERISNQLDGGPRMRQTAQSSLLDIADPAAIPAIELILATRSYQDAVLAMQTLGRIEAYQASLALARHAVFSPWPAVRETATDLLRSRRLDDFVPPMLELLATPVETREVVFPGRKRGELIYTQILARETARQVEVSTIAVPHQIFTVPMLTITATIGGRESLKVEGPSVVALNGLRAPAFRAADDRLHQRELAVGRQNELTEELNRRLMPVLVAVSGQKENANAQFWWEWWDHYSDVQRMKPKGVIAVQEVTPIVPVPVITNEVQFSLRIVTGGGGHSCFKAGTPVWTETGMVPIERLQVGDRVLSQNVETGELAYKPVLYKSLRPAKQLLRVAAGGEELVCTGGHRFWVAGEAWTKARELTSKDLLHTATGTLRVDTVSPADTDETHNLVVADFHSYFVGRQAFLVQDLPLPRSTNCVVPGLPPEW